MPAQPAQAGLENETLIGENATDRRSSPARETLDHVTPFAFHLDESLIGKSLARPGRRALALLMDIFLVGAATMLPIEVLALLLAWFCAIGMRRQRRRGGQRRWLVLYGVAAAVCLLTGLAEFNGRFDGQLEAVASRPVADSLATEAAVDLADPAEAYSLVNWLERFRTELGLGLSWTAFYFTVMLAWFEGKTLGKRVMGIRVIKLNGQPLSLWESFGRYGGYGAGLATGLLGFLQVYWDPNRQAIHDKISATVVIREYRQGAEMLAKGAGNEAGSIG